LAKNILLDDYTINDNYLLVFGGDYIDRGYSSVAVIIAVMLLKLCSPNNVVLLRGNHEETPFFFENDGMMREFDRILTYQEKLERSSRARREEPNTEPEDLTSVTMMEKFCYREDDHCAMRMKDNVVVSFVNDDEDRVASVLFCHGADKPMDDILPDYFFGEIEKYTERKINNWIRDDLFPDNGSGTKLQSVSYTKRSLENRVSMVVKGHDHKLPFIHRSLFESMKWRNWKNDNPVYKSENIDTIHERMLEKIEVRKCSKEKDLRLINKALSHAFEGKGSYYGDGAVNISQYPEFPIWIHIACSIVGSRRVLIKYNPSFLLINYDENSPSGFRVRVVEAGRNS